MSIDWNAFTPVSSLAGGVPIGIAAAMFTLLNGRLAKISGVRGRLQKPVKEDFSPGGSRSCSYAAKVQGFLDVAGSWDPSPAPVIAGAVAVGAVASERRLVVPRLRAA